MTFKLTSNSNAPPDLGDLVRAVIEGPPPRHEVTARALAAKRENDKEARDKKEARDDEDGAADSGSIEQPSSAESDDGQDNEQDHELAASADGEVPTAEFEPLQVIKSTKMYNPSVDKLVDRLEEVKVLSEEESIRARVDNALRDLKHATADLRGTAETMLFASEKAIAEAETVCQQVYALLDLLQEKYPELIEPREPLIEGLGFLERLIEERRPESAEETEINEERMAEELGIKRLAELERQQRRRSRLVFAVMLLAVARIGWGVFEARVKQPANPVVTTTKGSVALTTNNAAGARERELKEGIPSVVELSLAQLEDGTLQTQVLAFDPDGQRLSMTYRWYENGKLIATTGRNELDARMVKRAKRYYVRVTATDGRYFSDPMSTPPLLTRRGAWRSPSKTKATKTKATKTKAKSATSPSKQKEPAARTDGDVSASKPSAVGDSRKRRSRKRKQRKSK